MNPLERLDFLREARLVLNGQIKELERAIGVRKRARNVVPECGSESAYQRHRHLGQETDAACRAAHAEHNRIRSTT